MAGIKYTSEMGAYVLPDNSTTASTGASTTSQKTGQGWTFLGNILPSLFQSASNTIVGVKQADTLNNLNNQQSLWQQMGFGGWGNNQAGWNNNQRNNSGMIWLILGGVGIVAIIFLMLRSKKA